jgi:hypothetical protein
MKRTLQENFFVEIAKLLTLPTLLRNLKKAERLMEEDKELQTYIESARYHLEQAEAKIASICKRNPESKMCKDKYKYKK